MSQHSISFRVIWGTVSSLIRSGKDKLRHDKIAGAWVEIKSLINDGHDAFEASLYLLVLSRKPQSSSVTFCKGSSFIMSELKNPIPATATMTSHSTFREAAKAARTSPFNGSDRAASSGIIAYASSTPVGGKVARYDGGR